MLYCPYCGKKLDGGMNFCGYCGGSLAVLNNSQMKEGIDHSTMEDSFFENKRVSLETYYEQANLFHKQEQYSLELDVLLEAEKYYPNDSTIQVKIGRAYRCQGKLDKAMQRYMKAVEMNPNEASVYCNIGALYYFQNQLEMALPYYEKAYHIIENNPELATKDDRGVIYANLALCSGKLGDFSKVAECTAKAEREGYDKATLWDIEKQIGYRH